MKKIIEILVIILCCKASIMHKERENFGKHCELEPSGSDNEYGSCNSTVLTELNDTEHDITHDSESVEKKIELTAKVTTDGDEIPADSSLLVQNKDKDVKEQTDKNFFPCKVRNIKDKSSKKANIGCFPNIFYRNHKKRNAAGTDENASGKATSKEFELTTTSNPVKPESIDSKDSTMVKSEVEVFSKMTVDFYARDSIKHISKERNRLPQAINNSTKLTKQYFRESTTRSDVTAPDTNVRSNTHNLFSKTENFVQCVTMRDMKRNVTMRDMKRNINIEVEKIRIIEKQLENNKLARYYLFEWHSLLCRRSLIELDVTIVKFLISHPSVYYENVSLLYSLRELVLWYQYSTYKLIKLYESLYQAIQNLRSYQNNLLAFETMLIRINYHYQTVYNQIVYKEFGLSAKPKQSLDNVISYMFETYTKIRNKHTIYATKSIFDEIRMLVIECTDILLNHLSFCVKIRPYIADLIGSVEFYYYMTTLIRFTRFLAETDYFFTNKEVGLLHFYFSYNNEGVMFMNQLNFMNTSTLH